jgi:hypothetical protein
MTSCLLQSKFAQLGGHLFPVAAIRVIRVRDPTDGNDALGSVEQRPKIEGVDRVEARAISITSPPSSRIRGECSP